MTRVLVKSAVVLASVLGAAACTDYATDPGGPPAALTSVSLNGAIHLSWTDNAFQSNPGAFLHYRVYSTSYDLDHNVCGTSWALEGTTVSPAFLASALANGQPRCFGVSSVSIEG